MTKSGSKAGAIVQKTAWLAILLFGGLGCTAQITGGATGNQGGLVPIATAIGGTGGAATPTPDSKPDACLGRDDPGPNPLRRLTASEYNRTAHDLFAGIAVANVDLLETGSASVFVNDVAAQTPSPLLLEQYQTAARTLASAALEQRKLLLPCDPAADGEAECGARFIGDFGRRAFRRPLSADETKTFTEFFEVKREANNFNVALELVLQAFLQSPAFLYRLEDTSKSADGAPTTQLGAYELASRLSYLLWGTMPDAPLFAAADSNGLGSVAELEAQARRMLLDERTNARLAELVGDWLEFDKLATLEKVPALFPQWGESLRDAMRVEARHLAERVAQEPGNSLETILTSRKTYVSGPLAELYGVTAPVAPVGAWIELDPAQRAGFLTQSWFLAALAHPTDTSPIFRGVFVLNNLLCSPPPPPPPDVNVNLPPSPAGTIVTNRQRVEQHSVDATCAGCHVRIDGVGFGLENFDAIGRYRTTDNGAPIDASGTLVGTDVDGPYQGGVELSERLAGSAMAKACMARQGFRFAFGRTESDEDECRLDSFATAFAAAGYNLREYMIEVVKSGEFRSRRANDQVDQ